MLKRFLSGALSSVLIVSLAYPFPVLAGIKDEPVPFMFRIDETDGDASDEEGARGFVARIYTCALERDYDEDGLLFWCAQLEGQQSTGLEVFKRITECPEFTDKNLNNEEYLKVLYKVFFDREPDQTGFEYWYYDLEEGLLSKDDVLLSFASSPEWQEICSRYGIIPGGKVSSSSVVKTGIEGFVERLYLGCLGREADEDGLKYWADNLSSGNITGKQAAYGFFTSPEFLIEASQIDDVKLVMRFYDVFLGRLPDTAGETFWLSSIADSQNPVAVLFNGFSDSPEFEGLCEQNGITPGDSVRIPIIAVDEAYYRFKDYYLTDGIDMLNKVKLEPKTTYKFCNVQGSDRVWEERTIPEADLQAIKNFADTYFDPSWTPGEKAAFALYWIHHNMEYDYSGSMSTFAVSALVNRKGQCAQYNGAMVELLCWLGYDACLIQGSRGRSAPGSQHFWCEVYIDGETYVVEVGNTKDGNWNYFVSPYSRTRKFIVCGQVMG